MLQPIISAPGMTPEEVIASLATTIAKQLKHIQRLCDRIQKLENKIDQRDVQIEYLEGERKQLLNEHAQLLGELLHGQPPTTNFNIK